MLKVKKISYKTAHYTLRFRKIERSETKGTRSILTRSAEF